MSHNRTTTTTTVASLARGQMIDTCAGYPVTRTDVRTPQEAAIEAAAREEFATRYPGARQPSLPALVAHSRHRIVRARWREWQEVDGYSAADAEEEFA
jgi:hypothetical protein